MTDNIEDLLKDLILLNSIIAVETLQMTENLSKIARKSNSIPEKCQYSHDKLREQIINILKKHMQEEAEFLEEHISKH